MTDYSHINVSIDGDVATLVLDRPRKLNAITLTMLAEIVEAADRLSKTDTRVVIVRGAGTSFSAGMDINTFTEGAFTESGTDQRYAAAKLGGEAAAAIEVMPQIAIAALHGHVVGGGIVLAAACDLRIAEEGTTFSIPEIDIGIPLAWGGIERLVREIGPARTKEFVLTCRPFTVVEAHQAGFVNTIVGQGEAEAAALDLARVITSKSRFAVTTTKQHVAEILRGDTSRDDARGLVAALDEPSWQEHRDAYLSQFT